MTSRPSATRKAVVVGAGPVGCLAAIMLAKQGWDVTVYEGRPDIRLPLSKATAQQRSINLAISHRGIAAILAVDSSAAERFLQTAIPMRGRMIHLVTGKLDSQLYDRHGQCINSIDRGLLNEGLLDEASKSPNVRIFFQHKVQYVDFDNKVMSLRDVNNSQDVKIDFDFCVGADGSYSVVRRQMMKVVRMDYQQEYLADEYLELKMPSGRNADGLTTFLLDPNHLHIWPRYAFMLIALPNRDKTFTCTLFAPKTTLEQLISPEAIVNWFKTYFPDALHLIGEKNLLRDFTLNPRSPLICTKANPYHYKDRGVLLGDAAHSMVPFYGQGLNCGLEDVRILSILLQEAGVESVAQANADDVDVRLASALQRYTETRHKDLVAICDLAMSNYVEMRHLVTTPMFIIKKILDNLLYKISSRQAKSFNSLSALLSHQSYAPDPPRGWLPLYTMVTFRPDISYAVAKRKAEHQSFILTRLGWLGTSLLGVGCVWAIRAAIFYHKKNR